MSNALESHIRKIAAALHEHQVARLYKIPNDIRIVDDQVVHGGQTPADLIGFTITGRVIVLECKMRKQRSLEIGPKGLKAHQMIAISEAHRAGGVGVLAWMNSKMIALIDAGQVNAYRKGRKSIAWSAIPQRYKHSLTEDPLKFFWPHF